MRAYEVSLDLLHEQHQDDEDDGGLEQQHQDGGESRDFLGGSRGMRLVDRVVEAMREDGGEKKKDR